MANVQQPSFCGHNQKGLIYILSLSSCDMVEEAPPSRFLLFFFLFLIPRTGDSRHRKRLLRHDVVQRWLLAEAERREHSSGPAAHQHGHQRHLPSDQGQGEEVGSDSILTPGLTSDPAWFAAVTTLPGCRALFITTVLLLKTFSTFSKFYAFLIHAQEEEQLKPLTDWFFWCWPFKSQSGSTRCISVHSNPPHPKKSELSLLPIATRKSLMCASVVWYISLCLKKRKSFKYNCPRCEDKVRDKSTTRRWAKKLDLVLVNRSSRGCTARARL